MMATAVGGVALAAGLTVMCGEAGAQAPGTGLLRRTWRAYVRHYVQEDGRVIDWRGGGISTSEGQAYGLIRAAWIDDRARFDRMLEWTVDNLQQGDPSALPAWKWGRREDGSWGVLDPQPAADADQWLAYALLVAAERWQEPRYRARALELLDQIWRQEVAVVGPYRVLLPGPWAAESTPRRLNPSYFLPFAWRSFARVDPVHPWDELITDAYALLSASMADGQLPPDWLYLDPATGDRVPAPDPAHDRYGFEAFRVSWTLAAEVMWTEDPRARALLGPLAGLADRWRLHGWIPAVAEPDGTPAVDYGYLGAYGALLPTWALARPADVDALYTEELRQHRRRHGWGDREDYYTQNWAWLGVALWAGLAQPPEALR